ncbi:secretin N-terminal domain-containing protein [Mameliella sediminis]|uniref:secretin N-terminal domain-containing protein n=1 Tax=Mameliella sediminis TaxID=2836866 RepID=UPI001C43C4D8|nr:secretin N-terminal domain-containing protein [Mameliella sediminis]MBY6113180.1 type II secretion system protein GspD [Antarctobacter heliothermus]MBY6143472.1 type II secretion system protein GspD [Mameliella alba]MBV7394463.1 type II secretion system protein GspD [Mameliella sediminis]MBY6162552.1 type II secretion system protein GspD [Mameliella alba]MBY6171911.1 type II secretion system protein GspD [Mameliella alba]
MAGPGWGRAWCVALFLAILTVIPGFGRAQGALDLRDADLRSFVQIVSEATNRNFVIDPGVRGTVTVLAPQNVGPASLYEIFLNVLEVNRLTIVKGVDADRIVPLNAARELSPGAAGSGVYETRVIPVRHIPVNEVVDVVRPLLPSEAVISTVPDARLIILSDRAGNHRRIQALIAELDQPRSEPIEMIRLRNADAREVLQVIQSMGIVPDGASISVDARSNALLVLGPQSLREQIRVLAGRLDAQQNSQQSRVVQVNYAQAATLADVVLRSFQGEGGGASGQIRIVPEPGTNSLLISAPADRMHEIVAMVHHLDRRPTQVLVEAVIFEMSVDGFADLSVQFGAILNDAIIGGVQFALEGRPSLTSLVSTVLNGDVANPGNGGVIGGRSGDAQTGIAGLLTAIAETRSTRLLSTPSILTLNGQEAEIVVAQNVPFVTGQFSQVGQGAVSEPFQTIERQDVGLTLNVTPQINADGTVRLVIKQEVSNLTNATSSAGGEITAKRALSTTVLVRDGNVIMLGGLLENGFGSNSQRVPGVSKLPLVGGLFRGKSGTKNQRVLLVMLRPRIVNSDQEATRLTRELAREAKRASLAIQPEDSTRFPQTPLGALPFDGADLNQPFDETFIDNAARTRNYPPLPSRLKFNGKY